MKVRSVSTWKGSWRRNFLDEGSWWYGSPRVIELGSKLWRWLRARKRRLGCWFLSNLPVKKKGLDVKYYKFLFFCPPWSICHMAKINSKTLTTCFNERWSVAKRRKQIQIASRQVFGVPGDPQLSIVPLARLLRTKQCRHSSAKHESIKKTFEPFLSLQITLSPAAGNAILTDTIIRESSSNWVTWH